MRALLSTRMDCPDAETLADLALRSGDLERRAEIADHASECESCRAALVAVFGPPGERIGRYVVAKRLGAGGMGIVHRARDPELQRDVAIKVLHHGVAGERLRREAQALARLAHPNVVAVYDVGEHEGQTFIAMALVDGQTLRRWLGVERSGREIVDVLCAAARGIEAAHAARLVHRDLKPDNVFVARDGATLVGDFGLACDRGEVEVGDASDVVTGELTETGTILGTPAYMAPEQADGAATEKSDQFSFCVMAYEALYGVRPFGGKTLDEMLEAIRAGRITAPVRDPKVSVERAIRRGLSADPAERFPSMTALRLALEPRRRRWPLIAGGVAALATASALTWLAARPTVAPEPDCAISIADTWNAGRRAGWIATLRAAGKREDAALELAGRIDRFADEWTSERRDACVAQGTTTAYRVACLETRRAELDATIASTGPEDVVTLWRLVTSLSDPATCRDASHAFDVGYVALVAAAARTRNADDLRAIADQAEQRGNQRAQLTLSLALATRALADNRLADADLRAHRALTLAESLTEPTDRVRALALSAQALCLSSKDEEADRFLELATAASRTRPETTDDVRLARMNCLVHRRSFDEAAPLLAEALARAISRHGAESFEAFELHHQLAIAYRALGRSAESGREVAEWQRLFTKFADTDNPVLKAQVIDALQRFDFDAAIEHQRALVEAERRTGDDDLMASETTLGGFYQGLGEWRRAVDAYGHAIEDAPSKLDEAHLIDLTEARIGRGEALLHLGNAALAGPDFARALVDAETLKRGDLLLRAQLGAGRVAAEQGDHARAIRILRAAIPALAGSDSPGRLELAEAGLAIARAYWQSGDRTAARTFAESAATNIGLAIDEATDVRTQRMLPFLRTRRTAIERWRAEHR